MSVYQRRFGYDQQKVGCAGMRAAVLGIDTSCYTTSVALVGLDGQVLSSRRKLLDVVAGERGLRQSEGLFQHVRRLPELLVQALRERPDAQIAAVSASTKPRAARESYMPVFLVGEGQARAAAELLRVPFYAFSHQQGHVRAAIVDSGIDVKEPYLALHLSGGTTEVLLMQNGDLTLLGGSLDLHAGQLVDRIGVRMGLGFPSGPSLEKMAMHARARGRLGVSLRGVDCALAGAENKAMQLLKEGVSEQEVAAEVFDLLSRTFLRQIAAACEKTGSRQALLAGGVASSSLLRLLMTERAKKMRLTCALCFARPELSGDNAVGVALLGADALTAYKKGD